MEKWAEIFNLPLPECQKCGICCLCVTPSIPHTELLEKAAQGNEFARDFLSIFIPYKNIDDARKISNAVVEKAIKNKGENLVFYHCRHYHFEKKCTIYNERPDLCRLFPGSPFVILDENCGFYDWANQCKEAYKKMQEEIKILKNQKTQLENIKYQNKCIDLLNRLKRLENKEYSFLYTVPSMCIVSPGHSWIK